SFFQAEDGIRDRNVTGVQTCALPISGSSGLCPPWCAGPRPPAFWRSHGPPARNPSVVHDPIIFDGSFSRLVPLYAPHLCLLLPRSEERRVGKAGICRGTR